MPRDQSNDCQGGSLAIAGLGLIRQPERATDDNLATALAQMGRPMTSPIQPAGAQYMTSTVIALHCAVQAGNGYISPKPSVKAIAFSLRPVQRVSGLGLWATSEGR